MPAAAAAGGSTIVGGGDALALRTAQELCALQGRRIVVLWRQNPDFARMVEAVGAVFVAAQPDTAEGVERAGVRQAGSIIALSPDDQLNLHSALLARDANPQIRIVLRQFNRTLAGKIEQNLTNCSVLSLAWHSAATYAAVAIDPSCFRGLQFPEPAGPLTGFALRTAENCELADVTVEEAEQKLAARILAIDGETGFARDTVLAAPAELIVYGDIARLENSSPRPPVALGARARNPTMPVVLRIADASLAESISRHFEIETTHSAAALAAPAFAGLSRFAGSRGRVAFAGREFEIGEFQVGRRFRGTAPRDAILIAVSRGGGFAVGHDFGELVSGDRALILVPPAPLREGVDALAAAAGPFLLDDERGSGPGPA